MQQPFLVPLSRLWSMRLRWMHLDGGRTARVDSGWVTSCSSRLTRFYTFLEIACSHHPIYCILGRWIRCAHRKSEILEKSGRAPRPKFLQIFKIVQFWQISSKPTTTSMKIYVKCKLQYIPIISFQTRSFHHLSFAHTTDYCEKCRFTPGPDPTEL